MSTGPLVSVVVRTKDRPSLLRQALESVARQNHRNLQAIVVNDGGCDVEPVIAELADRLLVHRVVNAEPRGRCAAANTGLALAAGEWLLFLDDDDLLRPEAIQVLLEAAGDTACVCYGRVDAFHYIAGPDGPVAPRLERSFGREFDLTALLWENYIPIHACLMPTASVRQVGGMDEALPCFEDWDLFLRLSDSLPFRFVDTTVGEYRLIGGSFIQGSGGEERQREGQRALIAKHSHRYTPDVVSDVLHFGKSTAILRAKAEATGDLPQRVERLQVEAAHLANVLHERNQLLISVIVVNYNGRHHLERCLPAVMATSGVSFEVILADNGSSDGSVAWTREHFPAVRILDLGHNYGFAEANRRAVLVASGAYVAFLNSDTVPEPGWLRVQLEQLLLDPGIAATCSTLRFLDEPELLNARGGFMTWLGFGHDLDFNVPAEDAPRRGESATTDVLFPTAAAMLMSKSDYEDSGGFDRAFFMYHEDVDLGWRLWLLGRRVVVCSGSTVYHAFGGTSRSQRGLAWREEMGLRHAIRAILKNYRPKLALRVLVHMAGILARQRAWGRALRVAAWNLRYIRGTLRERRWIQRRRQVADWQLVHRGLISDAPYPPPTPEAPRAGRLAGLADWIPSPVLLPGQHSALGRLGFGWYARERAEEGWLRWTCGRARCFLRVEPDTLGSLTVRARLPEAAGQGRTIQVTCNGTALTHRVTSDGWNDITLPVRSSADGTLVVEICSEPSWVPHYTRDDADFRRLGCGVQEIRFRPAVEPPAELPSSVSVIVPTYNRWPILERTLEALASQSWSDLEVIIVDDGSSDGTWDKLLAWRKANASRLALTPLRQENAGPGRARNLGLRHASGDLVVFIGDDTIPQPELVAEHVAKHREMRETIGVLGFTDWDRSGMRVTPFLELVNNDGQQFCYGHFADGEDLFFTSLYTSNISLPRWVLGEDPFRPEFTFVDWEDTELGYRLSLRGLRLILHRGAVAHHHHPMTLRAFYRRQKHVGRTAQVIVCLHPELADAEAMPALDPDPHFPWYRWARYVIPVLVPFLDLWDRLGLAIPDRLTRAVLQGAFFAGRRQGYSPPADAATSQ